MKIAWLAVLLMVVGCGKTQPPPVTEAPVQGQIFITTKNGQSIKLGGVDVYVCNADKFWSALAPKITANRKAIEDAVAKPNNVEVEALKKFSFLSTEKWEGVISSSKSDADGKFTLAVPTNSIVVACTERTIGNKKEMLFWAVQPKSERLLLENSNLYLLE